MELQKKEIIKNYLLDEKIPVEERKERFKIAWDLWENFESIKEDIRRELAVKMVEQLNSDEFLRDYEIKDFGFETKGKAGCPIIVFKHAWSKNQSEPLLFYSLEFWRSQWPYFWGLHFGIQKKDNLSPFEGNWRCSELSPALRDVLNRIMSRLEDEFNKKWYTNDGWIAYLDFNSYGDEWTMWKREFYERFFSEEKFEDSLEKTARFYVEEFKKLIRVTEREIDNLIKLL
jgi:hypothetical protein